MRYLSPAERAHYRGVRRHRLRTSWSGMFWRDARESYFTRNFGPPGSAMPIHWIGVDLASQLDQGSTVFALADPVAGTIKILDYQSLLIDPDGDTP